MWVSRNIVLGLLAELRARGIAKERLFELAGFSANDLESPRVEFALAHRAVAAAYMLTKDPALALHLGSRGPTHMLDVVGAVVMHSRTIRHALEETERYLSLLVPAVTLRLEERGELARLVFEPRFDDVFTTRVVTELMVSFAVRIGRHFVPEQGTPIELRFAYPAPPHRAAYSEVFGCPVRFDCARTEYVFAASMLDEPQPFSNEPLHHLLKLRADELLTRASQQHSLEQRLLAALEQEEDLSDISLRAVAKRLGMSTSVLRRKLREENTSFTATLDLARREMAMRSLRNPEIPIKQIAAQTGFSEPSAFHRAFRRWTGSTPARFRSETREETGVRRVTKLDRARVA